MRTKRRILSFFTLIFILIVSWVVFNRVNKKPVIYTDFGENIPQIYPILGIDVSHHQGAIDWPYVANMKSDDDSVQFVYIKASEGISHTDDRFKENTQGASLEELPFGCYHYYIPSRSAKKQAKHFVSVISESGFNLRPALDIEVSGDLRPDELIDSVKSFLDEVEALSTYRPMIYTYERFYLDNLDHPSLLAEYYWIANYNGECNLMPADNVLSWQFSESGTVDGIEGKVDLNIAKEYFFDQCLTVIQEGD